MGSHDGKIYRDEVIHFLERLDKHRTVDEVIELFSEEFAYEPMPGFRKSDPSTSQKAALEALPRAKSQRRKVLSVIVESGDQGATYADVEENTGINGCWKRISELRQGGWVSDSGNERFNGHTGSYATVWVATQKALEYAI